MTSRPRTRSSRPSSAAPSGPAIGATLEERWSATLQVATALLVVATGLLCAGYALPVLEGAADRGFGSGPLLIALALLPLAVSLLLAARGRTTALAGLIVGAAALAPGRALVDLQFAVDGSATARPELYLPTTLGSPAPAAGWWLLMAGHVVWVAAGAFAVAHSRAETEALSEGDREVRARGWAVVALAAVLLAVVGLLMAPVGSTSVYLVAGGAFESSSLVLAGGLLMAATVPLAMVVAFISGSASVVRGVLVGLATVLVAIAVPNLVSAAVVPVVTLAAGPVVLLAAAVLLAVTAATRLGDVSSPADPADGPQRLPGSGRVAWVTAVLAVVAGAAAVLGGTTEQLAGVALVEGLPPAKVPESPATGLLVTAGVVVGLLGLAVLLPKVGRACRPVLAVAWVVVPVAGTAVLDTAATATEVSRLVTVGPGVWWTVVAMVAAASAAVAAVVGGMIEREEADDAVASRARPASGRGGEPVRSGTSGRHLAPLVVTAVLTIAAFVTPVVSAPDYTAPTALTLKAVSWAGLLLALLVLLGAQLAAAYTRPGLTTGLLAGSVVVLGFRAVELPLVGGNIAGSAPAVGLWLALAAVVALVIAAVAGRAGALR
ncbi:hypothetical protein [Amycolatopsis suaedae]|uniref:Uncharacterized protein n=1 Tax=Amycolatopsis suaedae TaxID=2510978 RepID=A0A4Q7J8J0_9PSEU|nr:hypothetical protein [Amycolatopsis suaedae]RZQ64020.1 hypothetical protein EWH70_08420 [Amycolatopsis suaedae]